MTDGLLEPVDGCFHGVPIGRLLRLQALKSSYTPCMRRYAGGASRTVNGFSVSEMPDAGEHHGHTAFIGSGNHLVVTH